VQFHMLTPERAPRSIALKSDETLASKSQGARLSD
jgi:hypothetical protein